MDEQRAWIRSRRRKRLRIVAVVLCICLLITARPDLLATLSTFASEWKDSTVYVSGFGELPETVREQAVPLGTGIDELSLPDTLEAFATVTEEEDEPEDAENPGDGSGDTGNPGDGSGDTGNPDDGEGGTENSGDGSGETGNPVGGEGDTENSGDGSGDTGNPDDGEGGTENSGDGSGDTGNPDDGEGGTENSGDGSGDTGNPNDGEGGTENSGDGSGDTGNPDDGEGGTENSGDGSGETGNLVGGEGDTENPGDGSGDTGNPGDGTDGGSSDAENPGEVSDDGSSDAGNTDDGNSGDGEMESPSDSEPTDDEGCVEAADEMAKGVDGALTVQHGVFVMPVYLSEPEALAEPQTMERKEESVMIKGVIWQSEPAYDGSVEGTYVFTAILPEGYALTEGVSLPQITVTVQGTDLTVQELLTRIAAMPEAEEYLADEPDVEAEDEYEAWMDGLSAYTAEALDLWEIYETLTEEQRALVPIEALVKLATWVELAGQLAEGIAVTAEAETVTLTVNLWRNGSRWGGQNVTLKIRDGDYYPTQETGEGIYQGIVAKGGDYFPCLAGESIGQNFWTTDKGDHSFTFHFVTVTYRKDDATGTAPEEENCYCGLSTRTDPYKYTVKETLPLTKAGYIQTGWSESPGGSGEAVTEIIVNRGTGNVDGIRTEPIELYPVFTPATVTIHAPNCTNDGANETVAATGDYTVTFMPETGYDAPAGVAVEIGGKTLGSGDYTYNVTTGTLTIPRDKITGHVIITAETAQHRHSLTYKVSGQNIVESCTNGCDHSVAAGFKTSQSAPYTYTGSAIQPFDVGYTGDTWLGSIKPAISYASNTNAGTATATLKYNSLSVEKTFTIGRKDISDNSVTVSLDTNSPTYTGNAITPTVTVTDGSRTLKADTDYTVSYQNNTAVGSATITITGKGNYTGTHAKTFTITAKSLMDASVTVTLSSDSYQYTGNAVTPAVTVKDGNRTLAEDTDYTVSYQNNTAVGTAAVIITGKGNYTGTRTVPFTIQDKAPEVSEGDLDFSGGIVKLPDDIKDKVEKGEVEIYDSEGNKITPNPDGSLPVEPGTTIKIKYPGSDKETVITIPGRPAAPAPKQVTVTDTTATVSNPVTGEEYVLVAQGDTPDWSKANSTGVFTGLIPNTAYDLYVRKQATSGSFASDPAKTAIRTSLTIKEPVIEGEGAGKDGNTVSGGEPSADGDSVTYTGTCEEGSTPVIIVDGKEYTPDITWGADGKGTWSCTVPVEDGGSTAEIKVEFKKRAYIGLEIAPGSLGIHADDPANQSVEKLLEYLKTHCTVKLAYDNGTSDDATNGAVYKTQDGFAETGGTYRYTVEAGGDTSRTGAITLTVSPVNAAVKTPDALVQTPKSGGYTKEEVDAWLPKEVTVTYTGTDGYAQRTESRPVTWSTDVLGVGFGAAAGSKTISGTADLPVWAKGNGAVSIGITFADRNTLTDDQMNLSISGWAYGAQTAPEPKGSVNVTDTEQTYTYRYRAENSTSWVSVGELPKSGSGNILPGDYQVEMIYSGKNYTGTKTAAFTVVQKPVTAEKGTLAVENRRYDGTTNATLKAGGKPALSGVLAKDEVVLGGTLKAAFTSKGPKKDIPVTVTGFALTGKDAGCYKLINTTLTLRATIDNKDGSSSSGGSGGSSGGDSENGDNGGGSGDTGDSSGDSGNSGGSSGSGGNSGTGGSSEGGGNSGTGGSSGGGGNSGTGGNTGTGGGNSGTGSNNDGNGGNTGTGGNKGGTTGSGSGSIAGTGTGSSGSGKGSADSGTTSGTGKGTTGGTDNGITGSTGKDGIGIGGTTGSGRDGVGNGSDSSNGRDGAGSKDTDTQQAGDGQQTKSVTVQTVQATADNGRIVLSGETEAPVAIGTLTEDAPGATRLLVGEGTVNVMVVCEDDQYTLGMNDAVAVANAVLTPEQIQLVDSGGSLDIRVDIKNISQSIPSQDWETVEKGYEAYGKYLPELKRGGYVDISVYMKTGEDGWNAVSETTEPLEVVIGIPEELRGDGREYYIIRAHEGKYTMLNDMDAVPETITIVTDLFSSYAIVYRETGAADAGKGKTAYGLSHISPKVLGIVCLTWVTAAVAGIIIVIIALRRKRRE